MPVLDQTVTMQERPLTQIEIIKRFLLGQPDWEGQDRSSVLFSADDPLPGDEHNQDGGQDAQAEEAAQNQETPNDEPPQPVQQIETSDTHDYEYQRVDQHPMRYWRHLRGGFDTTEVRMRERHMRDTSQGPYRRRQPIRTYIPDETERVNRFCRTPSYQNSSAHRSGLHLHERRNQSASSRRRRGNRWRSPGHTAGIRQERLDVRTKPVNNADDVPSSTAQTKDKKRRNSSV